MATIRAFKAIRPSKEYAGQVIALPYDVMSREEAAGMASGNPMSFLRVSRAEIDLPNQENPYDEDVYRKGRETLCDFIDKEILVRDEEPALYIYRQVMDGRQQTGVVCCASVDEYLNGLIKKHELTRVDKENDRINHFDACNANTEPVLLTYRDDKRIRSVVEGFAANGAPEHDITTPDGIRHIVWRISDKSVIEALVRLFGEVPSLYIADGHHRCASSFKVGLKRRQEHPGYDGSEEFNFFLAAIFPDGDLRIFDYNRIVKDLNGNTAQAFIDKIKSAGFEVEDRGESEYKPESKHTFGMFLEGKWYKLTAKREIIPEDVIGALDVSILQSKVLAPILGIDDPRTDKRIDFIGGIRGLSELSRRASEDMKAAFAIYPVQMEDLLTVSDEGRIMPPKSTWFEPKLGSGLFVHEL